MNGKGIVLLADNNENQLSTTKIFLEDSGCKVVTAMNPMEARRILKTQRVHLAILDIRLDDDDDERDISGLLIARETEFRKIPKLILTGYPTSMTVRDALKLRQDGSSLAWDYISKDDPPEELLQAVDGVFSKKVKINWELDIQWGKNAELSFPYLLTLIETDFIGEDLAGRIGEFEDLFRKLFYDFDQLTISELLWNKDSQIALEVFAYSEEKDEQFIVTFGMAEQMQMIETFYDSNVPSEFMANNTSKFKSAETMRYGAIAWALIGADLENLSPLSSFFRQKTDRQVRSVLEDLFQFTLKPWYASGFSVRDDRSLVQAFFEHIGISDEMLDTKTLQHKLNSLSKTALRYKVELTLYDNLLRIRFSNGEVINLPNPIPFLAGKAVLPESQVFFGSSVGNLDPETILVDGKSRSWVIDFSESVLAPIWSDFIEIENQIRFGMVDDYNLFSLYEFEKVLLSTKQLDELIPPSNVSPDERKVLNAIQIIRQEAASVVSNQLLPYYVGLFLNAAKRLDTYDHNIRITKHETLSLVYRVMFCAMLCEIFSQSGDYIENDDDNSKSLIVDDSRKIVTIGDVEINLTPKEYDLLFYLYQHADQLCSREEIITEVFGYGDLAPGSGKTLLNTHINRLRKKIEPDPSRWKFLVTIRGHGYQLILNPD